MIEKDMPEKMMTKPEDVSKVCSFLMTKASDTLYGTVIPVTRASRR